jgi:hypothetical protein
MPYYFRQCLNNQYSYVIQPGDTFYNIAVRFGISLASILAANPGIDPYNLLIGQTICIPSGCPSNYRQIITAMQSDINMLRADSEPQKIEDSNYGSSTQTTRALKVTESELQFDAAPVVFPGNYTGHYTVGQSYPYYPEAASGGQRGITVKDNFGLWHIFGYHVPIS